MSHKQSILRKLFFNASTRLVILAVLILLQLIFVGTLSYFLDSLSVIVTIFSYILGIIFCLVISVRHDNPSTRIFWLILIAMVPTFGIILYLMWGFPRHGFRRHALEHQSQNEALSALRKFADDYPEYAKVPELKNGEKQISRYLETNKYPGFSHTTVDYFADGESLFDTAIEEMKHAQRTIFIAFFILRPGQLWDRVHPVLCERALSGIDIRILVDDAGTMFHVDDDLMDKWRKEGIHIESFNPTHKYINNLYLNYRNHQKFIIIDSDIGYTGGINLSDEYANITAPLGHWKDTGVRLKGAAVFGMTTTFISMWEQTTEVLTHSFDRYRPSVFPNEKTWTHVFADGPYNNPANPVEGMIYRMMESASEELLITTPYLAVSQAFLDALCRVAQSGVAVSLLVPYRLDHWYVFEVTRGFFKPLMDAGVKIYRYTPGMLHAKMICVDNEHAMVGSINLDNRSFYIQYEDGVWFTDQKAVMAVSNDIRSAMNRSHLIEKKDMSRHALLHTFLGLIFRIFAPLM